MCAWCMSRGLTWTLICPPPHTHSHPQEDESHWLWCHKQVDIFKYSVKWNDMTAVGLIGMNCRHLCSVQDESYDFLTPHFAPSSAPSCANFKLVTFTSALSCTLPLVLLNVSMLKHKANRKYRCLWRGSHVLTTFLERGEKKKKKTDLFPSGYLPTVPCLQNLYQCTKKTVEAFVFTSLCLLELRAAEHFLLKKVWSGLLVGGCIDSVPQLHPAFKCQDIRAERFRVTVLWDILAWHGDRYLM